MKSNAIQREKNGWKKRQPLIVQHTALIVEHKP